MAQLAQSAQVGVGRITTAKLTEAMQGRRAKNSDAQSSYHRLSLRRLSSCVSRLRNRLAAPFRPPYAKDTDEADTYTAPDTSAGVDDSEHETTMQRATNKECKGMRLRGVSGQIDSNASLIKCSDCAWLWLWLLLCHPVIGRNGQAGSESWSLTRSLTNFRF